MTEHRSPQEQVADLFVFAPLGLALEARRLVPELAARGRRQIVFTRTVGKYAVRRGQQRLDDLVGASVALVANALPGGRGGAEASNGAAPTEVVPRPVPERVEPAIDPEGLAIPDYDSLSAFQVMPRLEALDAADLDAVREYEESTRGRRTILNKISQLS